MSERMTALSIHTAAQPRTWVLQADRQAVASLRISHAVTTSGQVRTLEGVWPIARDRRRWWEISAGDPEDPIVKLGRETATIKGQGDSIPWEIRGRLSRFHAVLGAYQRTIVLDVTGLRVPTAELHVSGRWEHRDLVVLTCLFALMAGRRRSIILLSG